MRFFGMIMGSWLAFGGAVSAQCMGQDLIAALPAGDLAPIRAAADAVPFAVGNLWRATKGAEVATLIGTLHLDDPRFEDLMPRLLPFVDDAGAILVEAGPKEEAELKARLAKDPSLLIIPSGPTLPEILTEADWDRLTQAMAARGVPGFMAAKLRPWYLSMLLSVPPCAMAGGAIPNGLDQRLMASATDRGLPIAALEPYDTAFKLFQDGNPDEQITLLLAALAAEGQSEDMTATMINSYFAEDTRLSWEFTKVWTKTLPGYDPAVAEMEFALMEESLMTSRNVAWIPVIEGAMAQQEGPLVIAFGALHLAGEQGVLNLLKQRGFTVERIEDQ